MVWLFLADISQRKRWNPLAVGGAVGTAVMVGGIWGLKWMLETYPVNMELESLLENFAMFALIGYLLLPIRMVSKMARGLTQSSEEKQTTTFQDYCAYLTLAFALGLIVFGGIGIPASLMRFGALGLLTLVALIIGLAGGVIASNRFNTRKSIPYPMHHYVYALSPLPCMGVRAFTLLFATALGTYLFY
jgi:hypothetical protein